MVTWAEAIPEWVRPHADEVADCYQISVALAEATGSEEAKGEVSAIGWVVLDWNTPGLDSERLPVTQASARAVSYLVLCQAADKRAPSWVLEQLGIVQLPRPAGSAVDHEAAAEWAYGAWRTLSWLLRARPDPPFELPRRLVDGSIVPGDQLYTVRPNRESPVWQASEARRREKHREEALRWWRRYPELADAAGSAQQPLPPPPAWVVRPYDEVFECRRVSHRLLSSADPRNSGVFNVLAWLTVDEVSPMTDRPANSATWEVARSESWVALCVAAGMPPPTARDWERLGVEPRPVRTDDREFAYGVWRTLAWLLGVRDDWPVYTSWQRAAEEPLDRPHRYAPRSEWDTDVWRAAEQASQEQAQADALHHWRHIRERLDRDTAQ